MEKYFFICLGDYILCQSDYFAFVFTAMQHYFLVIFGHDGQKPLELRTEEESDCNEWVECIQQAR